MGGYVVAHLKRDIVQLGEKVRRILFSKCICFYWFLVFLKFWIFGILNTYFSTTISVISDLVLLSFELRILNFGFFKSHCQPLNFGFFLWSWALKTRLEGSVFFAGGVLNSILQSSWLLQRSLHVNCEAVSRLNFQSTFQPLQSCDNCLHMYVILSYCHIPFIFDQLFLACFLMTSFYTGCFW